MCILDFHACTDLVLVSAERPSIVFLIFGAQGVVGAAAAGVLLTATGTAGALAYAAWAAVDRRLRQPSRARARAAVVVARSAPADAP